MPVSIFGALVALWAITGCGENDTGLTYPWDDRKVMCSMVIDDVGRRAPWGHIEREMARAQANNSVVMLHAHAPGGATSFAAIDRVLAMADAHHLEFFTYRDLVPGARPRAGLALAFDDHDIDMWFSTRDLLGAHRAHVTLFVTYWATRPAEQRAQLHTMASEGDDVEPHSVNHLNAPTYVAEHRDRRLPRRRGGALDR